MVTPRAIPSSVRLGGCTRARARCARRRVSAPMRSLIAGEFPSSSRDDGSASSSASVSSPLERKIATTTLLRERFESDPFTVLDASLLTENAEYDNDIYAVRGAREYSVLMKHFGSATVSAIKNFRVITQRASCVEPGVLLIQWSAEWEGAPAFSKNMILAAMHQGAARRLVEGEFGEKLAPGYAFENKEKVRDRKCRVFGRTTYRVDGDGLVISRQDRLDFRTDPEPGSQSMDDEFYETLEEIEEDWERYAEETSAYMFYNTLSPPDKNESLWLLHVITELEWQSFNRQMSDTAGVLSKSEYITLMYTFLASAIFAPIFILVGLSLILGASEQAVDSDSLDAALSMAEPTTGANGSPLWGAQVFLDLYHGKIGA